MENPRGRGRPEQALGSDGHPVSKLGLTVRAWRKHRNLSVTELADRAQLGESGLSYISQIEHGYIQHLVGERLERIAHALDITTDTLLMYKSPPAFRSPAELRLTSTFAQSELLLQPDDDLSEYTDPDLGAAQLGPWLATLSKHRVVPLMIQEVSMVPTVWTFAHILWHMSLISDAKHIVPRATFQRIEALHAEGVPFRWWLLAEHKLPTSQHVFSTHSMLIGVIPTTENQGAWCLVGKWLS